jgi:hypothetical protein
MKNKVADWIASIKQEFRYTRRTTSSEKFLMLLQPKRMARKLLKTASWPYGRRKLKLYTWYISDYQR